MWRRRRRQLTQATRLVLRLRPRRKSGAPDLRLSAPNSFTTAIAARAPLPPLLLGRLGREVQLMYHYGER